MHLRGTTMGCTRGSSPLDFRYRFLRLLSGYGFPDVRHGSVRHQDVLIAGVGVDIGILAAWSQRDFVSIGFAGNGEDEVLAVSSVLNGEPAGAGGAIGAGAAAVAAAATGVLGVPLKELSGSMRPVWRKWTYSGPLMPAMHL